MKKALIAMSGGVDSSVAAYLMKQKGYDCIGCTMKLYAGENTDKTDKTCCSSDDTEDARSVSYKLGMPYYVFNFTDDFNEKIIKKFIRSYTKGFTPNPCIDCNRYMKFEKLSEKAKELGYDYVVTGHYAKIEYDGEKYLLKKGRDLSKDQSYVLYSLTQDQLAHTLFPLGDMEKTEIRKIASEQGFVNAHKKDSQDICFVPDGDYAGFLKKHTDIQFEEGDFVGTDGKFLGRHKGIITYTVGQRKGLGIAFGKPMYVCSIDAESNKIILGEDADLYGKELTVKDFNWISGVAPETEIRCKAKIRYRHQEQAATAWVLDDGSVKITFDTPQRAITKGQAAVLYDGDTVLGGGVISG